MNNESEKALTPKEIVEQLDRYIIGQAKAKRSVAIALRSRWRRKHVDEQLREEIAPKNIIMIGPTGVGKTEIARRLARLSDAPFIKVEATKYTEVGYVGRDVESIIRDLVELGMNMVREQEREIRAEQARTSAEERVLDLLLPTGDPPPAAGPHTFIAGESGPAAEATDSMSRTRELLRRQLREGRLDEREIEIEQSAMPGMSFIEVLGGGSDEMSINLSEMMESLPIGKKKKKKSVKVPEALEILQLEETDKLIDPESIKKIAIEKVEQNGIVFIDELDKVAGSDSKQGPDVSRSGVQRDILPIVEGSTVMTKHGPVRTDHILFIAAGAFHMAKPSDLLPELQGRFPIRVNLESLTEDDFVKILTEPENALITQYVALMATEGVELEFGEGVIREIASVAAKVNQTTENIGARRLHTVMETLLDELSFNATEMTGQKFTIDAEYVRKTLAELAENEDLSRFIL